MGLGCTLIQETNVSNKRGQQRPPNQVPTTHLSVLASSQEHMLEQPSPYWLGGQAGVVQCDPSHPSLQKQRPEMWEHVAPLLHSHSSVQLTP